MNIQNIKNKQYEALAYIGKIFSHAKRLEIINTLMQKSCSVEQISKRITLSVASTSQHLQVLKRAQAVQTERRGTSIIYSLTDGMIATFVTMRQFAHTVSPELQLYQQSIKTVQIDYDTVQKKLSDHDAILLDVRTQQEFAHTHMQGAINIPLGELQNHPKRSSLDKDIIVTCRGPYCVSSIEAVQLLQHHHHQVFHYMDGVGEWEQRGGTLISSNMT